MVSITLAAYKIHTYTGIYEFPFLFHLLLHSSTVCYSNGILYNQKELYAEIVSQQQFLERFYETEIWEGTREAVYHA